MEFIALHSSRIAARLQIRICSSPPIRKKIKRTNSVLASGSYRWQNPLDMATPNYAFEKRRRELDKKAKKEEKRKQKLAAALTPDNQDDGDPPSTAEDELQLPEDPSA